jgi:dihydrofolate reductase
MPRDLIVTENITVTDHGDRSDMSAVEKAHRDSADAVLFGRVTFEQMAGYWPHQENDTTGVTDYLNTTRKYVVSRTLTDPSWQNSTVLGGDLTDEVTRLKNADGRAIVATGSIRLVRELARRDLVDEYRLWVYPVVLGRGERLFADATGMPKLTLAEATPFRSGIVLMRYRRA